MEENLEDEEVHVSGHIQTHAPEVLAAILDSSHVDKQITTFNKAEDQDYPQQNSAEESNLPNEYHQRHQGERHKFSGYPNDTIREIEFVGNPVDIENVSQEGIITSSSAFENTLSNGIKGLHFCDGQEFEEDGDNLHDSLELSSGTFRGVLENGKNPEKDLENAFPCCSTPVEETALNRRKIYSESGEEGFEVSTKKDISRASNQERTTERFDTERGDFGVERSKEIQSNQMKNGDYESGVQQKASKNVNKEREVSRLDSKSSHPHEKKNNFRGKAVSENDSTTSLKSLPKKTDIIERNINQASERRKHKSYRDIHSSKTTKKASSAKGKPDQSTKTADLAESKEPRLSAFEEDNASEQTSINSDEKNVNYPRPQQDFYPGDYENNQHLYYGYGNFIMPHMYGKARTAAYDTSSITSGHKYPFEPTAAGFNVMNQIPHNLDSSYGSSGWYNSSYASSDTSVIQPGLHAPALYPPRGADTTEFSPQVTQSAPPKTNYYSRPPLIEQVDFQNPNESGRLSSTLATKEFLDNQSDGRRSNYSSIHKRFVSDSQLSRTNPLPPISGYSSSGNEGYSSPKKQISYKPYTLKDFKSLKPVKVSGGLGPSNKSNSYIQKAGLVSKQKEYAEFLRAQHAVQKQTWEKKGNKPTAKEENIQQAKRKRQAAINYAKSVPKPQSGVRKQQPPSASTPDEKRQVNEEKEVTLLELLKMRHEKEKNQVDAIRKDLKTKLK